jgi:TctA family transporter
MNDPVGKLTYWIAITAVVVATCILAYIGWAFMPEEYFLVALVGLIVIGGLILDWYVAKRQPPDDPDH